MNTRRKTTKNTDTRYLIVKPGTPEVLGGCFFLAYANAKAEAVRLGGVVTIPSWLEIHFAVSYRSLDLKCFEM